MATIQERLAQKAASSIATGVANSQNVFGGVEAPPASPAGSLDPILTETMDPETVAESQQEFLTTLAAYYKGPAFFQNNMRQAMMPGGKFLRPDPRGVYVAQNEIQLQRLEHFESKGLLTRLPTKE